MRSDVAERRRGAAFVGLEPPRVVVFAEEPVLQVAPVQQVRGADVAAGNRFARQLHQRIAAVVERHRMNDARAVGGVQERLGIRRGHRERLFRHDVLASCDRRGRDRVVQVVGRRNVHDVNIRIVEQSLVVAVALRDAQAIRGLPRRRLIRTGKRHDVDKTQATDGIHVVRAHEACADKTHPDAHVGGYS